MDDDYSLDEQVGFLLRRANQRHASLFHDHMPERLTAPQFATLARLRELGPLSQNLLGRRAALDAATIKGIVDRLVERGLLRVEPDPDDGRRSLVSLTEDGEALLDRCTPIAEHVTEQTLAPVAAEERPVLLRLLGELAGELEW